jgi:hypothetical protein
MMYFASFGFELRLNLEGPSPQQSPATGTVTGSGSVFRVATILKCASA